jgi:hypothetical protein
MKQIVASLSTPKSTLLQDGKFAFFMQKEEDDLCCLVNFKILIIGKE